MKSDIIKETVRVMFKYDDNLSTSKEDFIINKIKQSLAKEMNKGCGTENALEVDLKCEKGNLCNSCINTLLLFLF